MGTALKVDTDLLLSSKSCSHSSGEQKLCTKSGGGESCAFDGAYVVLNPIRDAAHLVHGSIVCAAHSYETRGSRSTGSHMYRNGFTTDLSEIDIIYGGEEKLYNAILYIAEHYSPSAIFVYSTCVPGVTGEDIELICKRAGEKISMPAIPVVAPGFLGRKNLGNRIAGEVLLNHVVGKAEPPADYLSGPTVNLLGEYNIAGENAEIIRVLERVGFRVLAKITGDSDFQEITYAHRSSVNLLVCGRALVNLAEGMNERYGIPFSEVSFFGMANTSHALRTAAELHGGDALRVQCENVIAEEESRTMALLEVFRKRLRGTKTVVYTGGVKSWSLISALNDLGMEVTACGTKKSSQSDIEKIKSWIGEERLLNDTSPTNLMRVYRETGADILIAGGRNQYLAAKERIPFIDVNQEKHTPYAGYGGLVNLARDIVTTMDSPVWRAVRGGAPWEA